MSEQGAKPEKVYGLRTCLHCRGICHRKSWRTSGGRRRRYWCSLSCLKLDRPHFLDADIELFYDPVEVVTP